MATDLEEWRRAALDFLPELGDEISDTEEVETIYQLWFLLRESSLRAHRRGDADLVRRIFAFGLRCYRSGDSDIKNAVAVSFYEHIFHRWRFGRDTVALLPQPVIEEVWELWELTVPRWKLWRVRRLLSRSGQPVPPSTRLT